MAFLKLASQNSFLCGIFWIILTVIFFIFLIHYFIELFFLVMEKFKITWTNIIKYVLFSRSSRKKKRQCDHNLISLRNHDFFFCIIKYVLFRGSLVSRTSWALQGQDNWASSDRISSSGLRIHKMFAYNLEYRDTKKGTYFWKGERKISLT